MKQIFWVSIIFIFYQCKQYSLTPVVGDSMPSIDVLLMDSSTVINTSKMEGKNSYVLLFFEPDCPHCQKEIESILKNIESFDNAKFCFLSISSFPEIKNFCKRYDIIRYRNVVVGRDTAAAYAKYFSIRAVPHTSIYTSDRRLKKIFASSVDAKELISALK
ncbi:TlpA family protein disulfide reductase [Chitinophaga varians]|uniref:TlpA family protein disulfide reductase n=1 Tax=Chitinophaga varians TaxID=2202339 RepID=UPI00165FAFCA|nr:redoxin family protein [Chitinophaga varians]MBC9915101.1 redoxin domain-containing protein [Chitinophaga varians]